MKMVKVSNGHIPMSCQATFELHLPRSVYKQSADEVNIAMGRWIDIGALNVSSNIPDIPAKLKMSWLPCSNRIN